MSDMGCGLRVTGYELRVAGCGTGKLKAGKLKAQGSKLKAERYSAFGFRLSGLWVRAERMAV